MQGEVLTTASDDSLSQSVVHVLPAVENTDNMIHLLLTDKLFATAVMDAINCGLLNYNITPDKVNLNHACVVYMYIYICINFPQLRIYTYINNHYNNIMVQPHVQHHIYKSHP